MATTTNQAEDKKAGADQVIGNGDERLGKVQAIVRRNMYFAIGAGAVPVPFVDLIGISAVQVKMLRELSNLYEIPFKEHKVKNIVGSLLTGTLSIGSGAALIFSALKVIPFVGTAAGFVAIPIAAGGLTYATAKVFVQHFESGGTFLDFNPQKVRDKFQAEFERGKDVAAKMKTTKPS